MFRAEGPRIRTNATAVPAFELQEEMAFVFNDHATNIVQGEKIDNLNMPAVLEYRVKTTKTTYVPLRILAK